MSRRFGSKAARADIIYTCAICHLATGDLTAHEAVCRVPAPRIVYSRCERCSAWTCNGAAHAANPCAWGVAVVDSVPPGAKIAEPAPKVKLLRRPTRSAASAAAPAPAPRATPATIFILDDTVRAPEVLETIVDLLGVIPGKVGVAAAGSRTVWAIPPGVRDAISLAALTETYVGGRLALYDSIVKVTEEIAGSLKIIAVVSGPDRGSRNKCEPLLEHLGGRADLRIEIVQIGEAERDSDYAKICSDRGGYVVAGPGLDAALVGAARA